MAMEKNIFVFLKSFQKIFLYTAGQMMQPKQQGFLIVISDITFFMQACCIIIIIF